MYFLNELFFNFWYWWYYEAFSDFLGRLWYWLRRVANITGFSVHIRYLFVPIYQQYNLWGRLFSLIFRLGVIAISSVVLMVLAGLMVGLVAIYLLIPLTPIIKIWLAILN